MDWPLGIRVVIPMMHLFVNGLAASAGGGLTYLRNVIPHLAEREDIQASVAVGSALRDEFNDLPRISFVSAGRSAGAAQRFWWEQSVLPELLRSSRADVLISAGNFALRKSPVPQILLSRNSLYTSLDFYRDLRSRGEYRMWLDTRVRSVVARRSILWADVTLVPSKAFRDDVRRWTGVEVVPSYHGFDRDIFFRANVSLPEEAQKKLSAAAGSLRILFVSHYTYYRNFETLIRALPMLKDAIGPRKLKLILTCKFGESHGYRTGRVARLLQQLDVASEVIQLGAIPYQSLSQLYGACDLYVTPAYTETFAHPLVEAMASGLPIVASDLPVHREICGPAALYFQPFSPQELAQRVLEVAVSPELSAKLRIAGLERAESFSWKSHVNEVVAMARRLVGGRSDPLCVNQRVASSTDSNALR